MKLPPEQQAIREQFFHTSATFLEFPQEDVEAFIPHRFDKSRSMYPGQIAHWLMQNSTPRRMLSQVRP